MVRAKSSLQWGMRGHLCSPLKVRKCVRAVHHFTFTRSRSRGWEGCEACGAGRGGQHQPTPGRDPRPGDIHAQEADVRAGQLSWEHIAWRSLHILYQDDLPSAAGVGLDKLPHPERTRVRSKSATVETVMKMIIFFQPNPSIYDVCDIIKSFFIMFFLEYGGLPHVHVLPWMSKGHHSKIFIIFIVFWDPHHA